MALGAIVGKQGVRPGDGAGLERPHATATQRYADDRDQRDGRAGEGSGDA